MNILQAISAFFVVVLILNLVLIAMGRISPLYFWIVLGCAFMYSWILKWIRKNNQEIRSGKRAGLSKNK